METWFIIIISLCISALLKLTFDLLVFSLSISSPSSPHKKNLPPGPTNVPVIGNFLWLFKSPSQFETAIRTLLARHGPIISVPIGSRPAVFIGSRALAHEALVQKGAIFADRPESLAASEIDDENRRKITSAGYGPTWRLLRRNIAAEVFHPARAKTFASARHGVLGVLIDRLATEESRSLSGVELVGHLHYAMCSILVLMCFGDGLDEEHIKEVERIQSQVVLTKTRFLFLNFWPKLRKIVYHKRYKKVKELRQSQEKVMIPLIRSRIEVVNRRRLRKKEGKEEEEGSVVTYVDSLLDLELIDKKGKLNEREIVSLCVEFLNAGTDTTTTALEWIMANLVKYPNVQTKLYEDIIGVVGPPPKLTKTNEKAALVVIKEEDLQRMSYVKCVVLEGLRRHPPVHFTGPHSVTDDVELEGYLIPKGTSVNFMVADMGWDSKVWDKPMEFRPERFYTNTNSGDNTGAERTINLVDLTGSREIKMIPFGAGRRICPALGLASLHLEFFIANLIWHFEWRAAEGDTIDLSEKQEINTIMKHPLRAHISPRGLPKIEKKLPPGPTNVPVISNFLWLFKSPSQFETAIRTLLARHGPIISIPIGSRPAVFIGSRALAHEALVQKGAIFADRPESLSASEIDDENWRKITSSGYGPMWRLLHRNITAEVFHPARAKTFASARHGVLEVLIDRLVTEESRSSSGVKLVEHLHYAMFSILVLMCFGDGLDEEHIKEVERIQSQVVLTKTRFLFLNFWPKLRKIVYHKRYKKVKELRQSQEKVMIPLIRSRIEVVNRRRLCKKEGKEEKEGSVVTYVDSLLDLELLDKKKKLNEREIVSLCAEFLNAGTDTTTTALEWIMANLVKYPNVQTKLYEDIIGVVGPPPKLIETNEKAAMVVIKEEDLQRMSYLKCVVLEGLRRHPPVHFTGPHSVTDDVELEGYLIPKGTSVNFMVADMGWDSKVWDKPMEFRPERFYTNTTSGDNIGGERTILVDLTGSREIKMIPFGAGRRICPALGLASLHLEFFIANLIWHFEWRAAQGDTIDLSEKQEINTMMKHPLRAHISPRA